MEEQEALMGGLKARQWRIRVDEVSIVVADKTLTLIMLCHRPLS
jgi:hypothetical protein